MKKYFLLALLFLLNVSLVLADIDMVINEISGPSSISNYEGQTIGGFSGELRLGQIFSCDYDCSYETSQGESGFIGRFDKNNWPDSKSYNFNVDLPVSTGGQGQVYVSVSCERQTAFLCFSKTDTQNTNTLYFTYPANNDGDCDSGYEHCGNSADCACSSGYHCESSSCVPDARCGDGKKNQGSEQCDGSDLSGKSCKSLNYDYGSLKCTSSCNFDTSNCGNCNNECTSLQKTCAGNGYKTCEVDTNGCYKWSTVKSCSADETCNSGSCVNINNDQNCGAIGNACDTAERIGSILNTKCTDGYTATTTKEVTFEKCQNMQCVLQKTTKSADQKCTSPNPYCQDGACGCSTGYEICESLKKCTKKKDVKLNQPCGCDFQCEEGFCDESSRVCVKGLNIQLSASNPTLNVGEETTLSLSVSNPLPRDITADITLSLGDSLELVEVLSGDQCAGSQCKLDRTTIPSGGKKDVTVKVKASSYTNTRAEAFVNYLSGSKTIELEETTSIKVLQCGNGKIEEGETSETCCIDAKCPADNRFYSFTCNKNTKSCNKSIHSYFIYGGIGALVLIFLIILGIGRAITHHKKHTGEKNKKKEEKKLKKEAKKQEKKKQKEKKSEKKEEEETEEEEKYEEEHKDKDETKEPKEKSHSSIGKEIEHLHALMEKGVLTKREFKKRKKRLLKGKS